MNRKVFIYLVIIGLAAAIPAALLAGGTSATASPPDESKVPHYFGPFPNYAYSPIVSPNVQVTIDGNGAGATAEAQVGANGAITGIKITNPGTGYRSARVHIIGSGSGAAAVATVVKRGTVTSVSVTASGAGYTHPLASVSGGRGNGAMLTAFGGVDSVTVGGTLSSYTIPTIDFDLPDDPNGVRAHGYVVCAGSDPDAPLANCDATGGTADIDHVVVTDPGSGYSSAPGVAIIDGTRYNPVTNGGSGATATATLSVSSVTVESFGTGYKFVPTVAFAEAAGAGSGSGAAGTATIDSGSVTSISVTKAGSGYLTGGIRKFIDPLPGLCDPAGVAAVACPTDSSKYIPLAVADPTHLIGATAYTGTDLADTYVIGLVQYHTSFSSDLPDTLVRGYVQIETPGLGSISQHFPLVNELVDGTSSPVLDTAGFQVYGVTPPRYDGPIVSATKDRPVRVEFHNYLPTGTNGDLFLPVDTTVMGSGFGPGAVTERANVVDNHNVVDLVRNPACGETPKIAECYSDNRASVHLHGGITPWISDGTPHQWITPAKDANTITNYPEGVGVVNVPDMDVCTAYDDGCQTFYYTNQQSARLTFYHDHAWGITRLNVYAGMAAGYVITDDTEAKLQSDGLIPSGADEIPLIIQDKTFVPADGQLAAQDPTWDKTRWGSEGSLWSPHVYMPAQNPSDPTGMSDYGRWMYGAFFWPPANPKYGPITNPYYDSACDPNTASFCEPPLIPGTPNNSVGMEAFNDTPVVNGTAYPDVTLEPKSYRLRILNAANDRFWNLQWYQADSTGTEVALKASEVAAANADPDIAPTPDLALSPAGPDWIQIGNEGGFLPAPTVVDGQQVTTYITDPTRFDVGNVDQHSLLLAPAERADVVVDFSEFAGKTIILYNDAPAAFPARVPVYDFYTGGPDLSPVGAPSTLPGYGPNTRTIMRVHISDTTPSPEFDLTALQNAFKHHADGSGVFESGQNPIVVGQAAYNSAYGTSFVSDGWCNAPTVGGTSAENYCDGFARINEQGGDNFGFNTLDPVGAPGVGKMEIPLEPKSIHDEMNASSFDDFARMEATMGLEAPGATPLLQKIILYPFINPASEIFDATNLPKHQSGDMSITPISAAAPDGTQIWKITHNGVDTHPLHFHLYDLQLVNRVTWDNIIIPPDPEELGWKETIRVSPLEDTIVAIRPIIPWLPFQYPNSIRPLNPAMPIGSTIGFNSTDANGDPTVPIVNVEVNFGYEYIYHCHILSHEEKDMMHVVSVSTPPEAPTGFAFDGTEFTWTDNSLIETRFVIQSSTDNWVTTPTTVETLDQPLAQSDPSGLGSRSSSGLTVDSGTQYRVVAENVVGYGGSYAQTITHGISNTYTAP